MKGKHKQRRTNMKKVISLTGCRMALFGLGICCVLATGCALFGGGSKDADIVGTWELEGGTTVVYDANGTITVNAVTGNGDVFAWTGTYTVTGNSMAYEANFMDRRDRAVDVEGQAMITNNVMGGTSTFTTPDQSRTFPFTATKL
jgi:hypothetical protein